MKRILQGLLIAATLVGSWLGMQAIHECGHVLGAWVSGGFVRQVILHPFTISRTELAANPRPLFTAWAGPSFGVLFPVVLWGLAVASRLRGSFLLRFFAGFCLVANGAYIAFGSIQGIGDSGEMLRNGSREWQLWLFGALAVPTGFFLWHGEGVHFGFGPSSGKVDAPVTYCALIVAATLATLEFVLGSR